MHISMVEFEDYAQEFICATCKLNEKFLEVDRCWEYCLKNWINRQFEKKDGRSSK
jgi:hypothetical protein